MREFTRYVLAHVHAVVLGDKRVLLNRSFVKSLKLRDTAFDPEIMRAAYTLHADREGTYEWNLNPFTLEAFIEESAIREHETVER